ncbi:MAG: deoxyhypusine synthase family protein [Desulfobacterales bacterium]|nr:deoxyhypusine synthase family protein [Desulfobacterales bacterium]
MAEFPIDLSGIKTYPLSERKSNVSVQDFGTPWKSGNRYKTFLDTLPNILAAKDIRNVIAAIYDAYVNHKTIILAMGAHVIKTGLNPIIIDLMQRGIISAIAMNGAGIIHDLEIAMLGKTSEDVSASLGEGAFGMAKETAEFICDAIKNAESENSGLGRAVGNKINQAKLPYAAYSLLSTGATLDIPITVHVAIGTDIIHMHPDFDASAAGAASHRDFRLFATMVAKLEGGVHLNIGSAVILPEVFLKAITLTRNLGYPVSRFTTVNMDFIRHYRPETNVVHRPTAHGGKGYSLIGHHEIMFPIIAAGVIERITNAP